MSPLKNLNLGDALLKRGKSPAQPQGGAAQSTVLPVSEVAMVLSLEQLKPNPDNPRTTRNPKYQGEIANIY